MIVCRNKIDVKKKQRRDRGDRRRRYTLSICCQSTRVRGNGGGVDGWFEPQCRSRPSRSVRVSVRLSVCPPVRCFCWSTVSCASSLFAQSASRLNKTPPRFFVASATRHPLARTSTASPRLANECATQPARLKPEHRSGEYVKPTTVQRPISEQAGYTR